MKRMKMLSLIALCVMLSCQKDDKTSVAVSNNGTTSNNLGSKNLSGMMRMASDGPFSQFIPLDSANKMISSYLTSIGYPANDSDLQSLIFNADSLRAYLADGRIKQVKFILAHTLNYVNAGHYGQNCGYQSGELTMIVAGYDDNNNYIYNYQNMVLDHSAPCPNYCPGGGTAAYPTLK